MGNAIRAVAQLGLCLALFALVSAAAAAGKKSDDAKPKVSDQPLTTEQLAIYKIILHKWMDDGKHPFNLGIQTILFDLNGPFGDEACAKGLKLEADSSPVVHRFRSQDI